MTSKKRNKNEILLLVEAVTGIVIGVIGIVCILVGGMVGLLRPFMSGVLFLVLGAFLLRKAWRKKNSENKK